MHAVDISWWQLFLGSAIMGSSIYALHYFKTGLTRSALISYGRMALQLILLGFYMKYIFRYDSAWINLLWVFLMIVAASFSVTKRSNLNIKRFIPAIFAAIVANVLVNGALFAFLILGGENFLSARYLIPIMGMVIGNTLNTSIVGIRSFFDGLRHDEERYKFYLSCGATRKESLNLFMSKALKDAFNPVIASTAAIGLIWLPGMMTGQILGGSDPFEAVKYQIMIVLAIFAGGIITVVLSIVIISMTGFDEFDMLKKGSFILKNKSDK